jgi:hypothetical protein
VGAGSDVLCSLDLGRIICRASPLWIEVPVGAGDPEAVIISASVAIRSSSELQNSGRAYWYNR